MVLVLLLEIGGVFDVGFFVVMIVFGLLWDFFFVVDGWWVIGSGYKVQGYICFVVDVQVDFGIVSNVCQGCGIFVVDVFVYEQFDFGVGEYIYGFGECFGFFVKNGQIVEVWNVDGGIFSEQVYKNVLFYFFSCGYGVLVNDLGYVLYEIGFEVVEWVQFLVFGEVLEYFVIVGLMLKDVFGCYIVFIGCLLVVFVWLYGLWFLMSFMIDYDEEMVNLFFDEMVMWEFFVLVFYFDCFWMCEFQWCDFEWDLWVFLDLDGMLDCLYDKDLWVCVWINLYIVQCFFLFWEVVDWGFFV